jgi:subtilisin family serine protease
MNGNCSDQILSEEYFDFIVDYDLALKSTLDNSEICAIQIDSAFASLYVPLRLLSVNMLVDYAYKIFPRLFGLLDTESLAASGVTRLRNIPGLNLRGQGVLIGIVDTGIDYTHKAFLNADGTTKIVSIWDQSIQSSNLLEGFLYGTEYTRDQINLALQNSNPLTIVPTTDEIGHGTFLAGTAAGNTDMEYDFSGVVPDAELVVVKLKPAKQNLRDLYAVADDVTCYQENDIMLGVKYLVETAIKLNRPISICIGVGTSQGAHDIFGAVSTYLSSIMQLDGVAVSIAAGNEGNGRRHYETLMRRGLNSETIELNVAENEKGFLMEIWGDTPNLFAIEMITPAGDTVSRMLPRLSEAREIDFILETSILNIIFKLVGSRSGAQLVMIRFQDPMEGIWRIIIHKLNQDLDLRINSWLPMGGFISENTNFINSSPYTTLTAPANSFIPISVTAYNNDDNNLYLNASRGFTRLGLISPDLTAPGVNIIGPIPGNSYTTNSGTSIAAAHTAGVVAMFLEWGKVRGNVEYMDGTDIKNLLLRGAQRDPNRDYPNRDWGYGILDIFNTFENLRGNI